MTEQERDAEHVAAGGGKCPCCKSDEIEGDSLNFDRGMIDQRMKCLACDSTWYDVYHLVGLCNIVHRVPETGGT